MCPSLRKEYSVDSDIEKIGYVKQGLDINICPPEGEKSDFVHRSRNSEWILSNSNSDVFLTSNTPHSLKYV